MQVLVLGEGGELLVLDPVGVLQLQLLPLPLHPIKRLK